MSGLLDFGTGALTGADTGYKVSGGNPLVTGAAAAGMGLISLFGGASDRRMEREANRLGLTQGRQTIRLNDMAIRQAAREDKMAREKEKKRQMFGQMLGQWFASRRTQGAAGGATVP